MPTRRQMLRATVTVLAALPTTVSHAGQKNSGRETTPDRGNVMEAEEAQQTQDSEFSVASPSGNLVARFSIRAGRLFYSLHDARANRELIPPSAIALELDGAAPLDRFFSVEKTPESVFEEHRPRLYGERASAPSRCRRRVVTLRETVLPHRTLLAELRVFDTGFAFCFEPIFSQRALFALSTVRERIEIRLPADAIAYESLWHEDEFRPTPISALKPGCWLPFTVRLADGGPYLCIAEVDNTPGGATQTLLSPVDKRPGVLITAPRDSQTATNGPALVTPWRVILVGRTPGELLENNWLLTALAPPSALTEQDSTWIRPGKAIRETTLSTRGGLACVDFAAKHGLRYVLYDAGWYGPENDDASDARRVSLDPDRVKNQPDHGGLDLPRVIAYGKERGIGIFLYVNHRALERQLSELAPLYQLWGVAGIKFGFVNTGTEAWTRWMREAIALCAKHHLLVDIHDAYRPVGLSGQYPNLLTQEGIRGNEHMPTPRHNCTLPFTRFISGAGDYTICYRNNRLKTTDAHQMALSVICYSPLQLLYWYGRPEQYEGLPELAFFDAVPTVWDETRVLSGEIGEYAVIARRSGRDWFVGGITNETERTLTVPFDFLGSDDTSYTARIYTDKRGNSGKADLPLLSGVTRIAEKTQTVRRGDAPLLVPLAAGGGVALWLRPV
jgi:alpha-glucosidase